MVTGISFQDARYFSNLMLDYLDEKEEVQNLYARFPKLENFKGQIEEKASSYSQEHREVLVNALNHQYKNLEVSEATQHHIDLLADNTTFTVTTGHQLNLFTGPLYFLYKIVSTINLTKELKEAYPEYNFVPIYWMASEDHDFEEINYFNFKGKKIHWNRKDGGAVGHLTTEGLDEVYKLYEQELGVGENADYLRRLFKDAYLNHDTLAAASQFLVNELFGKHGLVVLDADDASLKELFVPYMKTDIFEGTPFKKVTETAAVMSDLGYNVQVTPREINLFYLAEGVRERIVEQDGTYVVLDAGITFTKEQLETELKEHPERFSPNVIMRPLYQEVILPNLCYIGGGGELAYWLELKSYFNAMQVTFPILLLRNSVLVVSEKQQEKLNKLNISYKHLFLKKDSFINKKVREISNIDIDFTKQRTHLEEQFAGLYDLAEQTDKSFLGAVKAQEVKQLKGLDNLEKRLLKAQKRKLSDHVERITEIRNELFPNESLQERTANFSELYLSYGEELVTTLLEKLKPLALEFTILVK
ncbi:bacillithiol biosynthesis cysteine-adding enzyme BshC [Neptunitalea lumnitzerae]|uniref:Putative cysteine ligase BshC n=1 Tax=Neptunitalea lumnitzerae TaxID=2965509 RepID=A0ABQ5MMM4_9FLAO|nr:bacillithiol biosynthesis cysteine-adding enzyme BshC [Neptunitalea sp. Y10]GLB50634.1 putative cysteine ligase BshC [Neptunitalea sp. Y10]